jgi:hypothetical protein
MEEESRPIAYSYIRFSTPEQSLGDSKRRQFEETEKYCRENKLILSDNIFHDEGVSAFKGRNKTKDAQLARFLMLCRQNKIKKGSYLLCEHIDRITREPISNAFDTVKSIIDYGIIVVTLNDKRKYSKETLNQIDLLCLIFTLFQSHDESVKKQERIRKSWENKRNQLISGKLQKLPQIPNWLNQNKSGEILVDEKKAATVIRIFDMFVNQKISSSSIHKTLNQENVPIISKKKTSSKWQKDYISRILRNQAVIGFTEFYETTIDSQTHKKKRILIKNSAAKIYPQIIDDETFKTAQIKLKQVKKYQKGRIGTVNLFSTAILKCARCNGKMEMTYKSKENRFIVCQNNRHGLVCSNKYSYPYYSFESSFLKNVEEINFNQIFKDNNFENEIDSIEKDIEIIAVKLSDYEQKISNLVDNLSILPATAREITIQKIKSLENEIVKNKSKITELKIKQDNITSTTENPKSLQELVLKLKTISNEEKEILKLKIKTIIHEQVDSIQVFTYRDKNDFNGFTDESWGIFIKKCGIRSGKNSFKRFRAYRIKYKFLKESRLVRGVEKYYKNASVLIKNVYEK